MEEKTLLFDIDGTICSQAEPGAGYDEIEPNKEAIEVINKLYDEGFKIIFHTARFMEWNKGDVLKLYRSDGHNFTKKQLEKWGVKFHELHMGKPPSHVIVDDRAIFFKADWKKIYEEIKSKFKDE
ncbi:MAG: hypothetical protein ABIB47_06630 [Candidatus Woesearchaeota archaeon]